MKTTLTACYLIRPCHGGLWRMIEATTGNAVRMADRQSLIHFCEDNGIPYEIEK